MKSLNQRATRAAVYPHLVVIGRFHEGEPVMLTVRNATITDAERGFHGAMQFADPDTYAALANNDQVEPIIIEAILVSQSPIDNVWED